jgi:hypothetical protein
MISLRTLPEATEPQHSRTTTYAGKVDASKKIFMATGIIVFDFELFIGGQCQLVSDIVRVDNEAGAHSSVGEHCGCLPTTV